jgi:hypothetical protein
MTFGCLFDVTYLGALAFGKTGWLKGVWGVGYTYMGAPNEYKDVG